MACGDHGQISAVSGQSEHELLKPSLNNFAGLWTTIHLLFTIFTLWQHPVSSHKPNLERRETGPGLLLLTNTLGPLPLLSQHHSCPLLPNHQLAMHTSPPRCPACSAWLAFQCDIYSLRRGGVFFSGSWLGKQGSVGCAAP